MQWIPGSNERERRLYLSFFDPRHRQTEIYTSCSRVCVCMAKGPFHTSPMVSNDMRTLSPLGPESLGRRNRTFFRVPSAHEIHEIQKSRQGAHGLTMGFCHCHPDVLPLATTIMNQIKVRSGQVRKAKSQRTTQKDRTPPVPGTRTCCFGFVPGGLDHVPGTLCCPLADSDGSCEVLGLLGSLMGLAASGSYLVCVEHRLCFVELSPE